MVTVVLIAFSLFALCVLLPFFCLLMLLAVAVISHDVRMWKIQRRVRRNVTLTELSDQELSLRHVDLQAYVKWHASRGMMMTYERVLVQQAAEEIARRRWSRAAHRLYLSEQVLSN